MADVFLINKKQSTIFEDKTAAKELSEVKELSKPGKIKKKISLSDQTFWSDWMIAGLLMLAAIFLCDEDIE